MQAALVRERDDALQVQAAKHPKERQAAAALREQQVAAAKCKGAANAAALMLDEAAAAAAQATTINQRAVREAVERVQQEAATRLRLEQERLEKVVAAEKARMRTLVKALIAERQKAMTAKNAEDDGDDDDGGKKKMQGSTS